MATREQWEELGKALVLVILLMLFGIMFVFIVASNGQVAPPPSPPMPPDLVHVTQRGCHIDGHHSSITIDAKTGEESEVVLWSVTPFARYDKLPDGTPREEWHPVNKDGSDKWIASFPGTSDYVPREATDACSAWMKALDRAKVKAMHEAGK